ncbi:hypothetical protein ACSHXN_16545 [Streptomyces sp. HUAS TT11]|uniref:lytic transglycosylase domain-containing protein n=1 Tax=Streptomyces sp. HUAS TT11 TaxID=3447508 RepID=UPI003F65BC35
MSRPLTRPFHTVSARLRSRRGLRGTAAVAVATVTTVLLTGSQAPGFVDASRHDDGMSVPGGFVPADTPLPEVPSQGDDSYHVELPPLQRASAGGKLWDDAAAHPSTQRVAAESGLPASVYAAYRNAETSIGRSDPRCRLRWQLLAAIGKVESGQAGGGAVDADGDTLTRITGPALDGNGFALILDSEGGVWDGDPVYDRAVGPMQFLPSTWKTWGADGNGDGTANPNNIYDAALAAGHYLCAGERDLGTAAGLERGILSYNYSRDYLNLVLGWMEFYLRGVHTVPDGRGVVPRSPGAGSDTPATRPVGGAARGSAGAGGENGSAGGPAHDAGATPSPAGPTRSPSPSPSVSASPSATAEPTPGPTPTESPTATPVETPAATPTDGGTTPGDPATTPDPDPEPSADDPACPGATASPTPTETPEATPSGTECPAPEETPADGTTATPAG